MPILQGTSGSGDAAWVTTLTDNLTLSGTTALSALLVPSAEAAVITADPGPTSAQSGTIYRCNMAAAGFSVTLPLGVVGQTYTFVLSDATNDLTINTRVVADSMLGAVSIMDDEGTTNSRSAAANGTTHDRCLIDVSAGVVVAGSFVKFTCLAAGAGTSVWFVEGVVISGDGAQPAVVFSSN
tara:strand:- start:328 stop:873 length:546 start_codon:yes stop_codon:yes gene_type:complete